MRVAQINAVPYGSTGRIMFQLADGVQADGGKTLCTAGFTWKKSQREDFFLTSGIVEKSAHVYLARLTGRTGGFSHGATRRLLKKLDEFQPDIIHLHNLHGWFVNLPMLFRYIKVKNIPVVWTLHDCWSFTGHCPHFDGIGCEKWKTECGECSLYKLYPRTWFDCSAAMYRLKREWFTGVENMTIVTPSQWLADCVKKSFLRNYSVEVIHNGIDPGVFCAGEKASTEKTGKYSVLGVAYAWDNKKGLDVFLDLRQRLGQEYRIILVGTDPKVDEQLTPGIESIHRTDSPMALAELYRSADVFVNPTREENYPTVNMEALACGTPVVTFATGGSPEIPDETCGVVVPKNDVSAMEDAIRWVCSGVPFSREACLKRAEVFDQKLCIARYLDLYRRKL